MDRLTITVIDRNNNYHAMHAPTNMDLNAMEVAKSWNIDRPWTCGVTVNALPAIPMC